MIRPEKLNKILVMFSICGRVRSGIVPGGGLAVALVAVVWFDGAGVGTRTYVRRGLAPQSHKTKRRGRR